MDELLSKYFPGVLSDEEKVIPFEKTDIEANLKKQFIAVQDNYSLAQMLKDENDDIEIIPNAIQQIYSFTYQKTSDKAIEVY